MIELPESYTLTDQLSQAFVGKTIVSAAANTSPHGFAWYSGDPALYNEKLAGRKIIRDAHEKPDTLFWNEWLKENPYTCAIDEPENWNGNGFAAIEQYTPFDPDAIKFAATMW